MTAHATSPAAARSATWITGRSFDLLCYIGPCLASWLLLYLNLGLGVGVMVLWWFWVVVVDGPHVFGTISRTYLDIEEWRARRQLLLGSLLWFGVGPTAVLLGVATGSHRPYAVFLLFASLWAYWHVVRQHYGFLCLYQRKNGEAAGRANPIDYWCYYVLMLAPLGCFALLNAEARHAMLLSERPSSAEHVLLRVLQAAVVVAAVVYTGKEWWRAHAGHGVNRPKTLFLLAVVPVHVTVCMYVPVASALNLLMFSVAITFHHNVQYHGIVWFHNRNRYGTADAAMRHGRAAAWISSRFGIYYAAGLLFTFTVRYSSWFFTGMDGIPGGPGPNFISLTAIGGGYTVSELAVAFWWGFALHHYYLDQKIWRVSRDRGVQRSLGVA